MGPTMGDAHVPVPMGGKKKKHKFFKAGRMPGRPLSNAERMQRVEAARARWRGHVALATGAGALSLSARGAEKPDAPDRREIESARRWGTVGGAIGGSVGALAGGLAGGGVASLATGFAGSTAGDLIGRQFFERLAYAGSANSGQQMAQRFFGGLPDEEQDLGRIAAQSVGGVAGSSLGRKLALAGRFTGTRGRLLFDTIGSAAGEFAGDAASQRFFGKADDGVSFEATITKVDEDERIVYGFASVSEDENGLITDRQGDQIETKELVRAAHDFIRKRQGKVMHAGKCVGEVVESLVLRPELQKALGIDIKKTAWIIGYKVSDDATWAKVKKGEFKGFSVGGKGKRKQVGG